MISNEKPKTITQLSKEQLEDMCLNLMHVDNEKANIIESLEQENQSLKDIREQVIKLVDELYDIGEEWYWDSYIIKEYVEKIGKILKGE